MAQLARREQQGLAARKGTAQLRLALPAAPLILPQLTPVPFAIDPAAQPPEPELILRLGAPVCLQLGLLPWRQVGGATVILAADPGVVRRHLVRLKAVFGPVRMAYCPMTDLRTALLAVAAPALVRRAEARVAAEESCRDFGTGSRRRRAMPLLLLAGVMAAGIAAPMVFFAVLLFWAVLTLVLNSGLKLVAGMMALRVPQVPRLAAGSVPVRLPVRLPVVSLLVPLYHERAIAAHLLARLDLLDYPRDRLDICLILEDDDAMTRAALAVASLPAWVQVIEVPQGSLRTKPRALNYALDFAKGSIIGIYDAEDAPAPDQIRQVVARFAQCGPEVACLQGALDYYNAGSNWLSRCFTLEYATWFRVMMPGLQRMGLVIPLGGTTLFLRRHAIEQVGGWDAHNVTEDADLGLRLARYGYRTELIQTVTEEEANARFWPWIKQRSRWLKGYAVTWAVHMRDPLRLWRDLGTWRFIGVQLLFIGTLSQFVLAPLLWTFWLVLFGLPHPVNALLPQGAIIGLGAVFLLAGLVNLLVAAQAVRLAGKGWLMIWAPTLQLYFPLGAIAAYKGLAELVRRPFYWHKTTHGIFVPQGAMAPPAPAPRRSATG